MLVGVRPGHLIPQGPRRIPSAQPLGGGSHVRRPAICKVGCHEALGVFKRKALPAGLLLFDLEELPERIKLMTM